MCTSDKLCFTNSILNDCNKSCKTLFSNYRKSVGATWKNGMVAYAHAYICDSLTKAFKDKNVIRVIDKLIKKQTFTDYCYENYIDVIISSIREDISNFSMANYNRFEDCEIAILDLLIEIYGEPNNPTNELYIRFLKLNPKPKSLESLQIRDKYIGKTICLTKAKGRRGQDELRKTLLKYDCRCKLCSASIPELLVLSHSKPWNDKNSTDAEKLDIFNVFLLCPNHDKAYDRGYISFNDNGTILVSPILDEFNKRLLNVNENMKINLEEDHIKYLTYHRDTIFQK